MCTRRITHLILPLAIVPVIAGCGARAMALGPGPVGPVAERYSLRPGGTLAVKNTNGDIRITPSDGGDVLMAVTKSVRGVPEGHERELLDAAQVVVTAVDDRVTIETQVATVRWPHASVAVDYEVKVPSEVDLSLVTGVGDITVRDVVGRVSVTTGVGDIQVERVAGPVEATASVGDLHVDLVEHASQDWLRIHAGVGDITATLPKGAEGSLRLDAGVGDIHTDFPIQVSGNLSRHSERGPFEGHLGAGGGTIELVTDVGDIRLRAR